MDEKKDTIIIKANNLREKEGKKKFQKENDKDYILPEKIAKRSDINKYYNLSDNILGKGSSGQVCIGEKNNVKYAIKRIKKEDIIFPELITSEIKISLNVKHKNIINYLEVYEDLKYISCVMDLSNSGDLFDFIINYPELGHLPDDIAIDLLEQIFETIKYLHISKKIIHRDLKPENFLVDTNKNGKHEVKLIDFGLAAYIPNKEFKFSAILGTKEYMAPEIFDKVGYNEKVDEWSAGIIMFNMLTGFEPFVGHTPSEIKENIRISPINFNLIKNEKLRKLNQKLLDRKVNNRITAKEALEEIKLIKNSKNI